MRGWSERFVCVDMVTTHCPQFQIQFICHPRNWPLCRCHCSSITQLSGQYSRWSSRRILQNKVSNPSRLTCFPSDTPMPQTNRARPPDQASGKSSRPNRPHNTPVCQCSNRCLTSRPNRFPNPTHQLSDRTDVLQYNHSDTKPGCSLLLAKLPIVVTTKASFH